MKNRELMKELMIKAEDALGKLTEEQLENLTDKVESQGFYGLIEYGGDFHSVLEHFEAEKVDLATMLIFSSKLLDLVAETGEELWESRNE